jgi:citrate lyase beta subunit
MRIASPYALGATLYIPALHEAIPDIVAGRKYAGVRSVVLCLEDALREDQVETGLANLERVLDRLAAEASEPSARPRIFVRPRHVGMAAAMAAWPGIGQIDGFVAPKVRPGGLDVWIRAVDGTDLVLMPTLETREMLDAVAVRDFRDELLAHDPARILALRIGGNDLMGCLGLRRTRGTTLYQGPLLYTISMLVGILSPAGFALTAPVCDIIDDDETLRAEARQDVAFGLVGKAAIHPRQIAPIEDAFAVSALDHEAARQILAEDAAAVFKLDGAMCEASTHRPWADRIIARAAFYGVAEAGLHSVAA